MEVLKRIDIFSTPVTFKIMDNEKYHSLISVSLSLIIMISTIIFTYFFGMDFIFHLESKVLQSTRINTTYEFYNLTLDEFFFAWQIEGGYFDEVNTTNILYPSIGYYSYKTGYNDYIEYKRCKDYNFSSKIPDDIQNYFCIDMSKYSQGGGFENGNIIECLYMFIDMCGKNTINGKYSCSTKQDFQNLTNKYNQIHMVVYYPTISFVPEENMPYQISYNKKKIPLSSKLFTQDRYYIQKYIFEDDNGWIVPKMNTYKLFGISEIVSSYLLNDIDDLNKEGLLTSYIYYGNFYIDRKYSYHKRSYTKIFESLSIIIAFYKILYVIFHLISSFCNEFLLLETIMVNNNGNSVKTKVINTISENFDFSNANYINNKNEQSKLPFKFSENNINILNIISKENNNIFSLNKENEIYKSNDNPIKKILNIERSNKNNIINLSINSSSKNKSIYRLFLLHFFHFFLPEKRKYEYQINYMNRKTFKKKLDVYNYLNLLKRVDFLFVQIMVNKIKKQ